MTEPTNADAWIGEVNAESRRVAEAMFGPAAASATTPVLPPTVSERRAEIEAVAANVAEARGAGRLVALWIVDALAAAGHLHLGPVVPDDPAVLRGLIDDATRDAEKQRHLDESDGHCNGDPCSVQAQATTAGTSGDLATLDLSDLRGVAREIKRNVHDIPAYIGDQIETLVAALAARDAELRQRDEDMKRARGRFEAATAAFERGESAVEIMNALRGGC